MKLVAEGVEVRFGGVRALAGVDVDVTKGSIVGVIGPNGSGKSTLFNCFSGFVTPMSGRVVLDGKDITSMPVQRRISAGLGRTFQTPRFDPRLPVHEAVACGFFSRSRRGIVRSLLYTPGTRRAEREVESGVADLLDRFGLAADRDEHVGQLSLGRVRLVEVARALATGPDFLLLDEPAAGLTKDEQRLLATQIRSCAASGVGVLLVEHNFDLVLDLCERITVLNNGEVLTVGTSEEVAEHPDVLEAYLGVRTGDAGQEART